MSFTTVQCNDSSRQYASTPLRNLPVEILDMIWEEILPSRVVKLELNGVGIDPNHKYFGFNSRCALPQAALTCHEFYSITQRYYPKAFSYQNPNYRSPASTGFNWRKDTLYLSSGAVRVKQPPTETFLAELENMDKDDLRQIRKLAVRMDYMQRASLERKGNSMQWFVEQVLLYLPALTDLDFVVDEYKPRLYKHLVLESSTPKNTQLVLHNELANFIEILQLCNRIGHENLELRHVEQMHTRVMDGVEKIDMAELQTRFPDRHLPKIGHKLAMSAGLEDTLRTVRASIQRLVCKETSRKAQEGYLRELKREETAYFRAVAQAAVDDGARIESRRTRGMK